MGLDLEWKKLPAVQQRFLFYSVVAVLVFFLLLLRLWYLQVINYEELQDRSVRNRTRVLSFAAPRGPIFDRHGVLLVDNRPSFQISVLRQDVENRTLLFAKLAPLLDIEISELEQRWQGGKRFPAYRPIPLAWDVSREIMERVQEHSVDLPGVLTEVRPVRDYLERGSAAHLIGYLGEITEDELKNEKFDQYQAGDYVGKTALERTYESYLRGEKGRRLIEVDVRGKLLRQLQVEPSRPGNKIYLTLDRELQRVADEAFGDKTGAVVALDVKTGEILAMASRPTFNPALFAKGITGDEWRVLALDNRHPLQNKVISGQYPPGSTFKMVVALAALRDGVIGTKKTIDCQGDFLIGGSRYRCWKKRGHGETNLKKALRESCDVWFYNVGLKLGIDKLSKAAKEFGLGSPTGYPLPGERSALMPSQEWKRQRYNKPWYAGETVIASIGQGFVLATPIQLAVMMAAIANDGKVLKPQVVKKLRIGRGICCYSQNLKCCVRSIIRRKSGKRFRMVWSLLLMNHMEPVTLPVLMMFWWQERPEHRRLFDEDQTKRRSWIRMATSPIGFDHTPFLSPMLLLHSRRLLSQLWSNTDSRVAGLRVPLPSELFNVIWS